VQPLTPGLVLVPALVDSALDRALAELTSAGFANVAVDSQAVAGRAVSWFVITQAPQAGDLVLPATLVRLSVRAVVTVPVPNLIGMREDDAALEGFPLRVVARTRALRLWGTRVARQAPESPGQVAPGTSIDITLSQPLPPAAAALGGFAVLAGLGIATRKVRIVRPRLETTVESELPAVNVNGDALKAELSLECTVERGEVGVDVQSENIISREERHV
jgi:hypothetical protein